MKKGQMGVNVLASVAIGLVVVAIVSMIAIQLLNDSQTDAVTGAAGCNSTNVTGCGYDYNASGYALEGIAKIPQKLPLIVTAVVGAILIGIVVTYFMRNK